MKRPAYFADVTKEEIELLDQIVKRRGFQSRADALRKLVQKEGRRLKLVDRGVMNESELS